MFSRSAKMDLKTRLKNLQPLVDTVRLILTEARHAFNLHSRQRLEAMAELQKKFTLAIDPLFEEVEKALPKSSGSDRQEWEKFHTILSRLELMADRAASLAEPLRYKANHGVILSEEEVFAVNGLFTRLNGLLQALVALFQRNDPTLREYMLKECESLKKGGFLSATRHQTQMMDTPGQPNAWSVYLGILDTAREFLEHLEKIVTTLA